MGVSYITRNTYPILSLLILTITLSSSAYSPKDIVNKQLLNKLCLQPTILSHRFCINWLTTDHRTNSINLHHLIEVAVEKTLAFGLNNQVLMRKLARGASTDEHLKKAYMSCANSNDIAIKELQKAKGLLSKSSFHLAYNAVYKAFDYAYACEDQFDGPSNEPEVVRNHSDMFIEMCHISRAFAVLLNRN